MQNDIQNKYTVKDFAEIIGTTPKTVYSLIKKDRLDTVNEVISGRSTTFIMASDKELELFKKNYGKLKVNESKYEDILTVNEVSEPSENTQNTVGINNSFDMLISTNAQLQQQLMTYTNELIESKSKQLLLEDKAGREGLYLKEINDLKKESNSKSKLITVFVTALFCMIVAIGILTFLLIKAENKPPQQQPPVTKIIKIDSKGNVVSTLTK